MKKNIILSSLLLLVMSFSTTTSIVDAKDDVNLTNESISEVKFSESDRDVKVGYLLRENFSPYDSAGSGWEQYNMPEGTGISVVRSSNTKFETYIRKNFVSQKDEITCELTISLASDVAAGYLSILGKQNDKEVKAILIKVEHNVLKYVDANGDKTTLGVLDTDGNIGIKIQGSANSNSCNVYINGAKILDNVSFNERVSCLSALKFGIEKNSTGGIKFSYVTVRKGYDVFEDLASCGINTTRDKDYDYCQGNITTNCTVNSHTIQNDNNALAANCYDNDDSTYWEHNTQYSISSEVYFMMKYGEVVPIDYIYIKFASYYKGIIGFHCCLPSGSWDVWGNSWMAFETTKENNYTLEFQLSEPISLTELAIKFAVGTGGYDISSGEIKVSTIKTKCLNPKETNKNTFPSDFARDNSNSSDIKIDTTSFSGDAAFVIDDKDDNKQGSVETSFNENGNITLEYTINYNDYANGNFIGLSNSNNCYIGIETKNKNLNVVIDESGNKQYIPLINESNNLNNYPINEWISFILEYDTSSNMLNVVYNGWNPIEKIKLPASFNNSTWTKFKANSSIDTTLFYFDSIKIYPTLEKSNVPAIDKVDTGDTIVTMQVCSLWREGTHTNWEVVNNEKSYDRQPVLGWYDEGTSEVADWEIKMAVEHGVSNFMYCWYRNGTGKVKTSNYSDAIWDGLFKSKFKEDINFSIMFENASSALYGYDDLINNLMPYWIETFFKNPNYQKTADGKPILYIYNGDILSSIGDVNNDGLTDSKDVSDTLNKMREMCVEAGFPGLYISSELRVKTSASIKKIEDYGYDSVFAYCWTSGQFNISDDETLAFSQDMLLSQRANIQDPSKFNIIPNISKSWDPSVWQDCGFNSNGAIYNYDLEHYREFNLWVKNVFGASTIDSYGTKMVMLDNWNEYSEGHWLFPTYGTPSYKNGKYAYGYLDILREVWGINNYSHKDYLPLEESFGPYDTWYPTDWNENSNKYVTENGYKKDDSVADNDIIDWEIGYNTLGGNTVYLSEITSNTVTLNNANRVVLDSKIIKSLKEKNSDLTIELLNGTLKISSNEILKLDENKSLEIVLNSLNDISSVAIAFRKSQNQIIDGMVFDYSLKQSGIEISINVSLSLKLCKNAIKLAKYIDGNIEYVDVTSTYNLNGSCYLVYCK